MNEIKFKSGGKTYRLLAEGEDGKVTVKVFRSGRYLRSKGFSCSIKEALVHTKNETALGSIFSGILSIG